LAGLVELVELLFVAFPGLVEFPLVSFVLGFVEFPLVEFVLFPPLVELPVELVELLVVVFVFVELPPV
jgi:hypothetical protein